MDAGGGGFPVPPSLQFLFFWQISKSHDLLSCDIATTFASTILKVSYSKGGLISESFSLWLKSPKTGAKSLSWELLTKREDAQDKKCSVSFFGDLSQSEKRSEIKPPLVVLGCTLGKMQLSYGHKKYHYFPVQNANLIFGMHQPLKVSLCLRTLKV